MLLWKPMLKQIIKHFRLRPEICHATEETWSEHHIHVTNTLRGVDTRVLAVKSEVATAEKAVYQTLCVKKRILSGQ
jgi:hypothetical protein